MKVETEHASDCAVHNAPAYEPGECDCGAEDQDGKASVEITPEMIKAGMDAFWGYYGADCAGGEYDRDVVRSVLAAGLQQLGLEVHYSADVEDAAKVDSPKKFKKGGSRRPSSQTKPVQPS